MARRFRLISIALPTALVFLAWAATYAMAAEAAHPVFSWKKELLKFVNFLIVVGVLWWLLKDRLPKFFADRRAKIDQAIEEAKAAKAEAEAKRAEYEAKIAQVEKEIAAIEQERARRVEQMKAELALAADEASARIQAEAEERIAAELNEAQAELQREASVLAVELAEELIKGRIGKEDQKKLFESTVEKLGDLK